VQKGANSRNKADIKSLRSFSYSRDKTFTIPSTVNLILFFIYVPSFDASYFLVNSTNDSATFVCDISAHYTSLLYRQEWPCMKVVRKMPANT
jgi:hypothetical protein